MVRLVGVSDVPVGAEDFKEDIVVVGIGFSLVFHVWVLILGSEGYGGLGGDGRGYVGQGVEGCGEVGLSNAGVVGWEADGLAVAVVVFAGWAGAGRVVGRAADWAVAMGVFAGKAGAGGVDIEAWEGCDQSVDPWGGVSDIAWWGDPCAVPVVGVGEGIGGG